MNWLKGKRQERERMLSIINTLYADWMKEMPCDRRSGPLNGAKIIKTKIEEGV